MKANELRIGNWVLNGANYRQVISLDNCIRTALSDKYYFPSDKEIHPIPLTPEILKKAGFEERANRCYYKDKMKFDFSRHTNICRFHWSQKITYLKNLHELQNLYHALTFNELDIEL